MAGSTAAVLGLLAAGWAGYGAWLAPTRILLVNALPAQAAEIALNNDSRHIRVVAASSESARRFADYDAVLLFGRGLYLDEEQLSELERAADGGTHLFTYVYRSGGLELVRHFDEEQQRTLNDYFRNPSGPNWRNLLRFVRAAATPRRLGDRSYEGPVETPHNTFYHREYGRYFATHDELKTFLTRKGLYHPDGDNVALISGVTFPVEGNRAHIDTLIDRLTRCGMNVWPIAASGAVRAEMLRRLNPDAIVYLPMGRLGDDELIGWTQSHDIPLFMPFPMIQSHDEWIDPKMPVSSGVLSARIVIPEIDGGLAPICIATQQADAQGYLIYRVEEERMATLVDYIRRYMALRRTPNARKRIAVGYFRMPGKDALVASGLEVVPSLYALLQRLRSEGYDVSGLPASVEAFGELLGREGFIAGAYAPGAQRAFLQQAHPVRIGAAQYERWASEALLPEKYAEVVRRYGAAPGTIGAEGDTLFIPSLRLGNVLLFPQPRPAVGDDEFKLQHGAEVAPPHNYIATYLYLRNEFRADALVHFGTHGNLEFTPGKNAALSQADWPDVLVGSLPHFYLYTTANVGEGIIAKRRARAALVTHLTPPYVESGMRRRYAAMLEHLHQALATEDAAVRARLSHAIRLEADSAGLLRDLGLDSLGERPYTTAELQRLDAFAEEIANEKVTGAFYTLGTPYSERDLAATVTAIAADPLAYAAARADRDRGRITTEQLQDFAFVARRYLPAARQRIAGALRDPASAADETLAEVLRLKRQLQEASRGELDALVRALAGGALAPAPGGDPVRNPNVLPTGRNMYSVNAETAPDEKAWEQGARLADAMLQTHLERHGAYPRKVGYTFWAGEFIATSGATLAQAFRLLGVEPVRDGQGRVVDLRLIPAAELGRPRVDVVVQVSGQLRDIAGSRLKLLTQAVRLAAEAGAEEYANYVAEDCREQERALVAGGTTPRQARELAAMRVFGPVHAGYSTGIMPYIEHSDTWSSEEEIARGYLNNMAAAYGDDEHWGEVCEGLFRTATDGTQALIQPRQSNTWGALSLDHVYEFTGALSLAVKSLTGREPDAYLADYRNPYNSRLQDAREAVAVEARATLLNPLFIRERMRGGAGSAEMFGKLFRNVFGWNVTRPSVLDRQLYDDLYAIYIEDRHALGLHDYFERVNPAALQTITAVMLESERKGYWQATAEQHRRTLELHAGTTLRHGAACTAFVCENRSLQDFIARGLDDARRPAYEAALDAVYDSGEGKGVVLGQQRPDRLAETRLFNGVWIAAVLALLLVAAVVVRRRR